MRRLLACLAAGAALLALPAPAGAAFGFKDVEVSFHDSSGEALLQAGAHPFDMVTTLAMNTRRVSPEGVSPEEFLPDGELRDLTISTPPGLVADPGAVPSCPTATFIEIVNGEHDSEGQPILCPAATAVGVAEVNVGFVPESAEAGFEDTAPIYRLPAPPGVIARLGFSVVNVPVVIDIGFSTEAPYRGVVSLTNISQIGQFFASRTTVWGNPSSPAHDSERGRCADPASEVESCPTEDLKKPFLTVPRSCTGPLSSDFEATAWNGGERAAARASTPTLGECARLPFAPQLSGQPTNHSAEGPSGFDFELDVHDEGLADPAGLAASDIEKAVVTLPEGVTANPSLAEGLTTCSPSDLARETLDSAPGGGCPQGSKVGTVEATTPLLEGSTLKGDIFIATQGENPFHSLLALYLVIREPQRGILVEQAVKIEPDPATGRLVSTMEDLPQVPLGHVSLHFREGGRSPLVTPPLCGTYTTEALFYPWANPGSPISSPSRFQITRGVGGDACPPGGVQPFDPGFEAGALDNQAAAYSPFDLRLTRPDGDQDLTRFSVSLPPGVTARLAGVGKCSDAAIAAAKAKSGREEQASPSCPSDSLIGHLQGGAGVGSQLTYVPGSLYLAGPFNGDPLSVVGIVPAVAGPFDVGTVVVREALAIDPRSGQATVDGAASDPIPHILAGIPLRVRDIRAAVDRPGFMLNPTNCDPFAVGAEIWGGGANPLSAADDAPVSRSAPFRAANCASLGFQPRLGLRLKGATRRGGFPAFHLLYRPRPGEANLRRLVLRFPHSEFIEQGHFRTICTRVQFAAGAGNGASCPKGSIYGHARVFTPILDQPAEGPVFLRSSNHNLPDVVLALHGPPGLPVHVEVPARIDSVHGGLRATANALPDLPVSRAVVDMRGGQRGLFVNSTGLCRAKHRANMPLLAQNGRRRRLRQPLRATRCAGHRGHRHRHRHRGRSAGPRRYGLG